MKKANHYISILKITLLACMVLLGTIGVPFAVMVEAAFNGQINYQGKLGNASGTTVSDGTYQMVFRLYTVSSGGTPIWTEMRTGGDEVTVTKGLFSVMLGEVATTSLATIDFNQTLYLGVTIESDSEMTPRKKLGAVPAAFEADKLDGLDSSRFLRSDTGNATTTTNTAFIITQNGTGDIANLFDGATEVFTVVDGGNVGIGSTTPFIKLSVGGDAFIGGNLTATGTVYGEYGNFTNSVTTYDLTVANSIGMNGAFTQYLSTFPDQERAELSWISGEYNIRTTRVSGSAHSIRLSADSGIIALDASSYLNWGTASGTNGYGFRDNSGTMEFKNTGGSWNPFGTGTVNSGTQGQLAYYASNGTAVTGTSSLFIASNSHIGIGTTSPYADLSIHGTSGRSPLFVVASSTGGAATSTHFLIGSDGRVGIGTGAPEYPLDLKTNSVARINVESRDDSISLISFKNGGDAGVLYIGKERTAGGGIAGGSSANAGVIGIAGTGPLQFATGANPDVRMTLDATGNLGIGTTTPGAKLAVGSGDLLVDGFIKGSYFIGTSTATSTLGGGLQTTALNVTGSATSTFAQGINLATGCFAINGTCVGTATGSGTVNSGTLGQVAYYGANGTAVSGTSSLFIASNSNVGIGTSTPSAKLDVFGSFRVASSTNSFSSSFLFVDTARNQVAIDGGGLATSSLYIDYSPESGATNATTTGIYLRSSPGTGADQVGIYNTIDTGFASRRYAGMRNRISVNNSNSTIFGFDNDIEFISNTSGTTFYGVRNNMSQSQNNGGAFTVYGLYNDVSNDSDATTTVYGTYSIGRTFSDNVSTFYGNYIASGSNSTGGTQYGVYADLSAGTATKYPGIFLGGNVGIGTTTPGARLSVGSGDLIVDGFAKASYFVATSTTATSSLAGGFSAASSFYVFQNGNVGIGTTSTSNTLSVNGSIEQGLSGNLYQSFGRRISWNSNGIAFNSSAAIGGDTGNIITIDALGGVVMNATNGAGIGIGTTTTSAAKLTVGDGSTNAQALFDGSAGDLSIIDGSRIETTRSTLYFNFSAARNTDFNNGQMMLTSAGSLGIGTTSPVAKLSLVGNGTGSGIAFAVANSSHLPRFSVNDSGKVSIGAASSQTQLLDISFASGNDGIKIGQADGTGSQKKLDILNDVTNSRATIDAYTGGGGGYTLSLNPTGGFVGVGSSTPGAKLAVGSGDLLVDGFIKGSYFIGTSTATSTLGGGLQTTALNVTGSASSTFAQGINLAAGCFAVNGVCISGGSGSGTVNTGSAGQVAFYAAGTNAVNGTSTITISNEKVGIGSTSPFAKLSIGITSGVSPFAIASSSNTKVFEITENGRVKIGNPITSAFLNIETSGLTGSNSAVVLKNTLDTDEVSIGYQNTASAWTTGVDNGGNFTISNYPTSLGSGQMLTMLNTSGFTGIGTTTPGAKLAVMQTQGGSAPLFMIASSTSGAGTSTSLLVNKYGFVGIGSNDPQALLDVGGYGAPIYPGTGMTINANNTGLGGIEIANSGTGGYSAVSLYNAVGGGTGGLILMQGSNTNVGTIFGLDHFNTSQIAASATNLVVRTSTSNPIVFATADTERMRILSTGQIGVGTTTPGTKFAIGSGDLLVDGFAKASYFVATSTTATSSLAGGFSAASSLYVLQNGNVGIGTTSPNGLLGVAGNIFANNILPNASYTNNLSAYSLGATGSRWNQVWTGTVNVGTSTFSLTSDAASNLGFYNAASGGGTQAMTLTTGGNLGIGTTTPYAKLSVVGEAVATNFTATSTSATSSFAGGFVVGGGAITYQSSTGVTSINALEIGSLSFDTNAGIVSWTDLPVTSAATAGTVQSYTAQIDGNPLLTVYGESNGSGGVQNLKVGIGSTTPGAKLSVGSGDLLVDGFAKASYFIGTSTATSTFGGAITVGAGAGTSTFAGGLSSLSLRVSGSATSTFAQGINLAAGCFAVNGTCISGGSGSGTVNSGTLGQVAYYGANGTAVSGTSSLTIASNSNVGIGTTTPTSLLHLEKTTDDNAVLTIQNSMPAGSSAAARLSLVSDGGAFNIMRGSTAYEESSYADNTLISEDGGGDIIFRLANEAFRLTNAGKVGIGSSSPLAQLSLTGVAGTRPVLFASSTGATLLTILENGNVGIGTSSPYAKLSVVGEVVATNFTATSSAATSTINGILTLGKSTVAGSASLKLYDGFEYASIQWNNDSGTGLNINANSAQIHFNTTSTIDLGARLYVLTNGNVGIGSSTPSTKLVVSGTTTVQNLVSTSSATSTFAGGVQTAALNVTGSATSTFAQGINIATGCFAVNGSCVGGTGGSGTVNAGSQGQLAWYATNGTAVSGTSSIFISPTTGNVGIGSTSPGFKLSVEGSVGISGSDGILFYDTAGIGFSGYLRPEVDGLTLSTAGTVLTLDSGSEVFTTDLFLAAGGINIGADAHQITGNGDFIFNAISGATTTWQGNGVTRMTLTNAGLLGIGTTSPGAKLSVGSGNALIDGFVKASFFIGTSTATSTLGGGLQTTALNVTGSATSTFAQGINLATGCFAVNGTCIGGGSGSGTVNSGTQGQLAYYASNGTAVTGTSSLFIASNSNVGIGSTTPMAKLSVVGGAFFDVSNGIGVRIGGPGLPTLDFNNFGGSIPTITSSNGVIQLGDENINQRLQFVVNGGATPTYFTPENDSQIKGDFSLVDLNDVVGVRFASTTAFLGIGTTTPAARLSVGRGDALIDGNVKASFFIGTSTTASQFGGDIALTGSSPLLRANTADASDNRSLALSGGGASGSGRGANIFLEGNEFGGDFSGSLILAAGDVSGATTGIGSIRFWTGSSADVMRITAAGNVGIGTTSPAARLDVKGNSLFQGTNTNIPLTATSAVEFFAGRQAGGAMNSGQTSADLAFQWGGQGGGYRHFISTEHNAAATGNKMLFYLNSSATAGGSTGPTVGNTLGLALDSGNVGVGTTSPFAKLAVMQTAGGTNNLFMVASSTSGAGTTTPFLINANGQIGLGSTTPTSILSLHKNGGIASTTSQTVGFNEYLKFDLAGGGTQFGNQLYIDNAPTSVANVMVGDMVKVADNTSLSNTVRGLEVQAHRGTNTLGENTGISAFGRTFGLKGVTEGDAGAAFLPAGIFAQSRGTTQGNALRAYSGSLTSGDLVYFYHDTSAFTGDALRIDTANSGGTFTGNFLRLQKAGVDKFKVSDHGTTTIGDGTNMAGLQIGFGGICVDNDGSCIASTTGRITGVQLQSGNSDLAELYFSDELIQAGEIVSTAGGYTVTKADQENSDTIIGVVSSKPGLLMGHDDTPSGEHKYPVALSGRVPIKVSNENGEIKAGDYIKLSSVPGVGMKADGEGTVVGIALEGFDGDDAYSYAVIDALEDNEEDPTQTQQYIVESDACYVGSAPEIGEEGCVKKATTTTKIIDSTKSTSSREYDQDVEREEVENEVVKIGKIQIFVNLGWQKLAPNAQELAEGTTTPWMVDVHSGQLKMIANGDLDLDNRFGIKNVKSISGVFNNWSIDENGKIIAKEIEAEKGTFKESLQVGTTEKPTGIVIYDTKTGEPYCMMIEEGMMKSVKGPCVQTKIEVDEGEFYCIDQNGNEELSESGECEEDEEETPHEEPDETPDEGSEGETPDGGGEVTPDPEPTEPENPTPTPEPTETAGDDTEEGDSGNTSVSQGDTTVDSDNSSESEGESDTSDSGSDSDSGGSEDSSSGETSGGGGDDSSSGGGDSGEGA